MKRAKVVLQEELEDRIDKKTNMTFQLLSGKLKLGGTYKLVEEKTITIKPYE